MIGLSIPKLFGGLIVIMGCASLWYLVSTDHNHTKLQIHNSMKRQSSLTQHIEAESMAQLYLAGIRSAYLDQALKIKSERMLRSKSMAAGISRKKCELLVVIPTGHRAKLGKDGYKYLRTTLDSIRHQHTKQHGFEQICVLVIDNTPTKHDDMERMRWEMQGQQHKVIVRALPDVCSHCGQGSPSDGGTKVSAEGTCYNWCSNSSFCGTGPAYQTTNATDCRIRSWWTAEGDDLEHERAQRDCDHTHCKGGTDIEGGVELEGNKCTKWCLNGRCGASERFWNGTDCNNMIPTDIRFVDQTNFNEPFPADYSKNILAGEGDQEVAATANTRRQGLHLSHSLLEASRWHSQYVMVVEDDMPFCDLDSLTQLHQAVNLTDGVCAQTHTGWSMLRVGFGGNGVIIHWDDAISLGQYLITHLGRRPVDWLMPEWAASKTFEALMINGLLQRKIFTYRYNLFRHIGVQSSIQGFAWDASASDGLPQCNELNTFLRGEETFDVTACRKYNISPCVCNSTWCT